MFKRIVSSGSFRPVQAEATGEASKEVLERFEAFQKQVQGEKLNKLDHILLTAAQTATLKMKKKTNIQSAQKLGTGLFYKTEAGVVYVDSESEGQRYTISLVGSPND